MFEQQKSDPVGAMAKKMGELFAIMTDEIMQELGEEKGREVASRAVRRFGTMRGKAIREAVLAAGDALTFENMEHHYDLPLNNGWDADSSIKDGVLTEVTRYCPFADAWRGLGMEKQGGIYCEIDIAINEAFMGAIDFQRPAIFSDGPNAPCEMIVAPIL